MWQAQDELLHSSLLEISEFLNFGDDERSSICNTVNKSSLVKNWGSLVLLGR